MIFTEKGAVPIALIKTIENRSNLGVGKALDKQLALRRRHKTKRGDYRCTRWKKIDEDSTSYIASTGAVHSAVRTLTRSPRHDVWT